jgi:integrase
MPDAKIEKLKAHRQKQGEQANTFGEGFNPHNLINCRADGLPMTSTVLNNQYRKILKDAGLPPLRFHDLRHTNATFLLRGNIPAKIVSSMLGHSNIGTTMDIYSHVLTEMQTPAAELINSLLK